MARKQIDITIEDGRDKGKTFRIEEMSAVQMDKWAMKALGLLGRDGADISLVGNMTLQDMLASISKAPVEEVQPLFDELLACCSFVKDGTLIQLKGNIIDSIVEDWTTLTQLKVEALKLNLGFLEQGGESESK